MFCCFGKNKCHLPGYNYCGPFTDIKEHLENNIKPRNRVDEACKNHDINYHLISTGAEMIKTVKDADLELLHDLDQIENPICGEIMAILIIKLVMRSKIFFQDYFLCR